MAVIQRKGFGQVELNMVIGGVVDAHMTAMTPVASTVEIIEQGQFFRLKQDSTGNGIETEILTNPGDSDAYGPFLMAYNEEYFYDERDQYHKDFAMKADDYYNGLMVPRTFQPTLLDVFTTNTFKVGNTDKNTTLADGNAITLVEGNKVAVNAAGFLDLEDNKVEGSPVWEVIKVYTMPDSQTGVKLRCIEA